MRHQRPSPAFGADRQAADERAITAHHEAGHAVAVVASGNSTLNFITINAKSNRAILGQTYFSGPRFDIPRITYSGPWAQARYDWMIATADRPITELDDEELEFADYIGGTFLNNPEECRLAAGRSILGAEDQGIFREEDLWNLGNERAWPAIRIVADELLAGRVPVDGEVRAIYHQLA